MCHDAILAMPCAILAMTMCHDAIPAMPCAMMLSVIMLASYRPSSFNKALNCNLYIVEKVFGL